MKQKPDDMQTTTPSKPVLMQGWLRVLIFCLIYFVLLVGSKYLIELSAAKFMGKQIDPQQPLPGTLLALSVVIAFVVSMACVFCFRQWVDRKSFRSLGFRFQKQGLAGLFLALFILGAGTLILYFSGHLKWTDMLLDGNALMIEFGTLLFAAVYEEVVFRGYILNNLLQSFNKWIALLLSALLFTLFHFGSPAVGLIPLVNIFLAGLLLGLNYIYTRNLWFPILFHLGWNFLEGPVLGYKISGVGLQTLLQTETSGDSLLTGGDFGFEGSLFATALTIIGCLLLYLQLEGKFRMRSQRVQDRK